MSQSGQISDTSSELGSTTFETDSGDAVEALGIINMVGAGGTLTSGAGNTVTITSEGSDITTDSGNATPSGGVINILGTAPITTSGAGNTVTVADDGTIPTSIATDSGTATPVANSISILGTGDASTSAAGSVITVDSTGQLELIATAVASASSTIEFTDLTSEFILYEIVISGVNNSTGIGVDFQMRTSSNNGSSFDAGAADYGWSMIGSTADTVGTVFEVNTGDSTSDAIEISGADGGLDFDAGTNEEKYFRISLYNPSAALFTHITHRGSGFDTSSNLVQNYTGIGMRKSAALVDAIQFLMSSGTILVGTFKLYGLRA